MNRIHLLAGVALLSLAAPALAFSLHAPVSGLAGPDAVIRVDHVETPVVELGELTLSEAFAKATLPNAPVAGGFLTIVNGGTGDDRLIAAESAISPVMQIHEMVMEGDVMQMRELADGLLLPAGQTVKLEPGGYHIMFMDLTGPLIEGEKLPVTLSFEKAGKVEIVLEILAPNAEGFH
jgi:periplasmic copper chaperone A